MAKMENVIVTLVDDLDGSEASETIEFSFDGKTYEIDLNTKNAGTFRAALAPYVEAGHPVRAGRRGRRPGPARRRSGAARASGGGKTLFSSLSDEDKAAFRRWADMPNARRITDDKVQQFLDAGSPTTGRGPASARKAAGRKRAAKTSAKRAPARKRAAKRVARGARAAS